MMVDFPDVSGCHKISGRYVSALLQYTSVSSTPEGLGSLLLVCIALPSKSRVAAEGQNTAAVLKNCTDVLQDSDQGFILSMCVI